MIIKVMHDRGFTLYGEVDLITVSVLDPRCGIGDEVIDHRSDQLSKPDEPAQRETYSIKFMNKNQTAETVILSHSPVYIMNDQGRTVETI